MSRREEATPGPVTLTPNVPSLDAVAGTGPAR